MKYKDYEAAFSQARLSRYLNACAGDKNKALILYRYNLKLCQKFYGVLGLFEVVFRNAVNEHYKRHFGDEDWIRTQIHAGGMLESSPQVSDVTRYISKLSDAGKYTHDRLVSSVSFGFWSYLFNKQPFRKGGQSLLAIFPHKTKGLGQRAIYNELMEIKSFRNRIAHHEPICFDMDGNKDVEFAQSNYNQILKYVGFYWVTTRMNCSMGMDCCPEQDNSKKIRDL